ncbi:serine hydrolase domain-containing protein [Nocardiopsis sp. NPDC055879]
MSDPGNPGEFEYSSANYLLIGAIVEAVTGTDYGSYLREAILNPAGMTDTFTNTEEARALGLAAGQRTLWGFPSPVPTRVDDGGVAYGYLGGDLDSLAAFARMQLVEDPPVLDSATLGEARTGAVERSPGRECGLGWWDAPVPGVDEHVVWHAGATPGFAAMMIVLPERERAVVVPQNGYDNLRDGEVQAVGFGPAHLLTGGGTPLEPETDPLGPALVWGVTAAIPLSVAGAVATVIHPRRDRVRRRWTGWIRGVFAALSVAAVVTLSATIGVRAGLLWFPEAAVSILVSGALGGFALVTLVVVLVRRGRGTRRPRPGSDR